MSKESTSPFDVAVIGAGPAGLAAAVAAAERGARVVVLDAATQPGGQFWRHRPESVEPDPEGHGHHGWKTYLDLRSRFDAAISTGVLHYLPNTQVWMIEREDAGRFVLRLTPATGTTIEVPTVRADKLVSCAGGYDRQLPLPGWELPGVMAAGGIQAFIKANGTLPGKRFVVAGTGPFLLPVAANIAAAGGKVVAVCESSSLTNWLPHMGAASGVPGKALEGAEYAAIFAKHRIRYRTRTVVTKVVGDSSATAVQIAKVDASGAIIPGSERLLEDVDIVGFGWGFTPQIELAVSLGAETRIDADGSLVCVADEKQSSTVPGLFLAGEVTGVGGAVLAVAEGYVAGASAANGEQPKTSTARQIQRHRRFASAMHQAHPVPEKWDELLTDDTLICRCEEVSHAQVTEARDVLGATDARTMKSFTRTGMGWCQGKVCGYAVSCLSAKGTTDENAQHASLTSVAKRPVATPLTLGEISTLDSREPHNL
ncbi:FAD/NAD(P)-binding oxidoreductase [Arthrobacter sp. MYb227]|uniref:NAD(P)/FAD-dependent oxidoreductase n=1 Tax=Arthrobacter sp. MYb227 TaxID=1848601 RepID=UPI000CFAA207|nr:NAD(P)/FAD-dependent oxidoreductase [Arthrobacter sp. MYb227]PQZ94812.1 FAD/NAD(P)-binding oxidoreductase [Arthrobacter sp. MYb227]